MRNRIFIIIDYGIAHLQILLLHSAEQIIGYE